MNSCVYCGFCSNFGCEQFAKASPAGLHLPLRSAPTFELRTGRTCSGVELDRDRKSARGVTYVDAAGAEIFQPAQVVILCAFAINNTPALSCLRDREPVRPATGKGVVGRNYTHQTARA
jgi:gluconate 2-dehydrogenase alpha chain